MNPIYILLSLFQLILGSASVYSVFNNAIVVGLMLIFALYLTGFIKNYFRIKNKKANA